MGDYESHPWLPLLYLALIVAALVGLHLALAVLRSRSRLRQWLCDHGFAPVRVHWRPLAYWAPRWRTGWRDSLSFEAVYADCSGLIQRGRFWVSGWGPGVQWVPPDVGYLRKPMSGGERAWCLIVSALCIGFATWLLWVQRVYVPGRGYGSHGAYWGGWPKNLVALAVVCAAGSLLTEVAYHYSRQTDERWYRRAARAFGVVGWTLFGLSLALSFRSKI